MSVGVCIEQYYYNRSNLVLLKTIIFLTYLTGHYYNVIKRNNLINEIFIN